ncbi:hypothetical protein C8J57DRAFT_1502904 [Mycena rebaudengoi]|nr:hypothetical protein C8J57DRAFT_1502904 [Mycena rebaudengoi]
MLFSWYFAILSAIVVASGAALPIVEPELAVRDSSGNRDWRRDSSGNRDWRRDSSGNRDWRRDPDSSGNRDCLSFTTTMQAPDADELLNADRVRKFDEFLVMDFTPEGPTRVLSSYDLNSTRLDSTATLS